MPDGGPLLRLVAGSGLIGRRANELVFVPGGDARIASVFAAAPTGGAIEAVTALVDADPATVADFVVVQWSDRLRIAVYGAVEVTSDHRSLPRLSASGAGTWIERSLSFDGTIVVRCGGGDVLEATSLGDGIVAAGGFELTVERIVGAPPRLAAEPASPTAAAASPAAAVSRAAAFDALSEGDEATVTAPVEEAPIVVSEASVPDQRGAPRDQRLTACAACLSPVPVGASTCPTCGHDMSSPPLEGSDASWRLVFEDGRIEAVDAALLLGRDPKPADDQVRAVELDCDLVSANHLQVRQAGNTLVVTDLGSRNGTFVLTTGDAQFVPIEAHHAHRVGDGAVVQLGRQRFTVERADGAADAPAADR